MIRIWTVTKMVLPVNKKYLISVIPLALLLIFLFCFWWQQRHDAFTEPKNYTEAVQYCQTITLEEVEEKLEQKESFLLYTGRESCPYCRRFAPKLAKAIFQTNETVYYLDSEKGDVPAITRFAKREGIQTVPNLAFYSDGKLQTHLEKGSKSSLEEIKSFFAEQNNP